MSDLLILLGTVLMALSVVLAIASLARTEPPRGAAIAFVIGVAALFAGAWLEPTPFRVQDLGLAWQRLLSGEIRL
ncbi:hypothetical protein SAMN05444389_107109 [Paracoccus solventivorans]|uniref:Uncharacterized protein n=2 Tax=Paracoccus TaxID=265 RepID=A0A1H6MLF8_9RHOB|nr:MULTISPECIES: hypothetical protein [Paracoccus]SEH98440.1 hypothetical protein SAMN04488075_2074 [Paracoccus alkenifer]SHM33879.1 hypothetical protein SAMN05444389_107109 [Paracoccus solventivorans]HHW33261.1 hypothetical protein [Paracoccus solventivorans]HMM10151.1 hypothetical protein [Paracoccus solventivorans]